MILTFHFEHDKIVSSNKDSLSQDNHPQLSFLLHFFIVNEHVCGFCFMWVNFINQ